MGRPALSFLSSVSWPRPSSLFRGLQSDARASPPPALLSVIPAESWPVMDIRQYMVIHLK